VECFSSSYPLLNHIFFKRERGCPTFWTAPIRFMKTVIGIFSLEECYI
jgi:hypothetical protein